MSDALVWLACCLMTFLRDPSWKLRHWAKSHNETSAVMLQEHRYLSPGDNERTNLDMLRRTNRDYWLVVMCGKLVRIDWPKDASIEDVLASMHWVQP